MSSSLPGGNQALEINHVNHTIEFSFENVEESIFAYGSIETLVRGPAQEILSRTQKNVLDLVGQKTSSIDNVDVYRFDDISIDSQSKEDEGLLRKVFTEFVKAAIQEYGTDKEIRINVALSQTIPDSFYQAVIDDLNDLNVIDHGKVNRSQGYVTFTFY
jgi:hypothetical protein